MVSRRLAEWAVFTKPHRFSWDGVRWNHPISGMEVIKRRMQMNNVALGGLLVLALMSCDPESSAEIHSDSASYECWRGFWRGIVKSM